MIIAAIREDVPPRAGARPPGRRWRWLLPLAVFALLAEMAIAMVTTAVEQTPTIDEPVYVGAAVFSLDHDSLRYNPEHPPLGKLVIATGLAFADVHVDAGFAGDQTQLGRYVLYEPGHDAGRLLLLARLPVIVLTLLFGLVVFLFARDLAGPAGGVVALALYALSPDLIAHGSLATLDVPVAGFLVTSAWLLWRARKRPWRCLPLAGLALGAAVATKMSALAAVPVVLILAALSAWYAYGPQRTARRLGAGVAAASGVGLIAVAVVWVSYLVVDPQLRWTPPPGLPAVEGLRSLVDLLPLPRPYLDGMRVQFGFEDQVWTTFLFGSVHVGALWYYLPAALLVKTPLGALALWLTGAVAMVAVPRLRPAAPYVLVPAAVLLAAAMTGSRDLGVRYALFVPMFLAVAAAGVVTVRRRWAPVAVAALVAFTAISSLRTFPYYLPYSNEAFGGPAQTHRQLHDSNVDWGQDLGRLAERLKQRHPGERVWLVYKGSGVPSSYGIAAADPLAVPPDAVHGLLVVSDSAIAKADDRLGFLLRTSTPLDDVGHSITIHRRQ
ncbi:MULTISPECIES: phospholipid carrier-dependent glycosyltransferase [unclassified Amycolatopsis]|uniref:ArnT family glycosyltransferase n=1 Tax=unclassified Amycolatopsis TaxID=2618356 RepID=UPI002874F95A|nr:MULTISPECIES: phospholipid carrier-dependent glycosyltransferase [unclassified Amycolatopsis]MDS0134303.1 phospholipid carrier-dependent glycosyltransferase [Amycolatopsis sp. 505]MDS0148887.1 phospholipid carrier-dependent glycosyltransferase [Amycolatopsis sp. CM201R]